MASSRREPDQPGDVPVGARPPHRRVGPALYKALEVATMLGSLAGAVLAVMAVLQVGPFSEAPDVRVDLTASAINAPGSDSASDEYICIVNKSGGDVDLLGWELRTAEGRANLLPDVTLSPDQRLRVHPGSGSNTESDVYGEGDAAVWLNDGGTANLFDDEGDRIDSQSYGSRESETPPASC